MDVPLDWEPPAITDTCGNCGHRHYVGVDRCDLMIPTFGGASFYCPCTGFVPLKSSRPAASA